MWDVRKGTREITPVNSLNGRGNQTDTLRPGEIEEVSAISYAASNGQHRVLRTPSVLLCHGSEKASELQQVAEIRSRSATHPKPHKNQMQIWYLPIPNLSSSLRR